jgi:putative ABC transport system permease protein
MRNVFRGERVNRELDEELEAHVAEAIAAGRDAEEVRRAMGSPLRHRQESRDVRLVTWLENFVQDVQHAARTLWKSRGFTAVAIVTLALGIGASTAIFSVIENVLLAPFPYKDAAHLMYMTIHDTQGNEPGGRAGYSSAEYLDYAVQNHVFDRVIAAAEEQVLYKQGAGTQRMYGAHVTPGTYEFLGVPAMYGRVMQAVDYEPGAPPVFVMRYKAWMSQFDSDLGALNKTFVLNGTPRTLIGVMPPRFAWYEADVMIPGKPTRGTTTAGPGFPVGRWFLLGHLKPGITPQEAQADLTVIAQRLAKVYPKEYPAHFSVQVASLVDEVTGRFRATLFGYFNVLRFQFKDGRGFTDAEVNRAHKVAVVNETFTKKYLGTQNPIGQRARVAELENLPDAVKEAWFEIVGVVADVKNRGLQEPVEPEVWIPDTVTASAGRGILLRTTQEPLSLGRGSDSC